MSLVLARIRVRSTPAAQQWLANAYSVHQRLAAAFPGDTRLLFRIEDNRTILVQSHQEPDWQGAFAGLDVLDVPPDTKRVDPLPLAGAVYRFRLLGNPVIATVLDKRRVAPVGTRTDGAIAGQRDRETHPRSKRYGLLKEEEQRQWLERKLAAAGAEIVAAEARPIGHRRSRRGTGAGPSGGVQTHFAVLFEGLLRVADPAALRAAIQTGIGPAKGYGFGLLSLAPVSPPAT